MYCFNNTILLQRAKRTPFYAKLRNNCAPPCPTPWNRKVQTEAAVIVLPSFHFGEVNCYKSIRKCFFIQVSAVSPNEGRHIIACKLSIFKLDILKEYSFSVLFKNCSPTSLFYISLHTKSFLGTFQNLEMQR